MDLDPWEWLQANLRVHGVVEPLTTRLYSQILRKGDVVLDIGAHVGYQALLARSLVRESGHVIAVEPQPYNAARILTNFHLNGWGSVTVFVATISDSDGGVTLQDQPVGDRSRLSVNAPSLAGDQPQRFWVPKLRLDRVIEEAHVPGRIRLVKIDTEGHEYEAITGLADSIARVDHFIIEVWDPGRPEYVRLANHLKESGFALRTVDGNMWSGGALPELNLWASRE
jgi:FkbM family methyltransferase